ncbi:hypothetical protein Micbo1qcDRAFT_157146, partial [Microdochium bolleyi]
MPDADLQQSLSSAPGMSDEPIQYMETDDPELVLQNALRALQQEEADAEAEAAVIREERSRQDQQQHGQTPTVSNNNGGGFSTPISSHTRGASTSQQQQQHRFTPTSSDQQQQQHLSNANNASGLQLTPISSSVPVSSTDKPVRCPFCVNQRMLRTIKEAVEHLSTHVV